MIERLARAVNQHDLAAIVECFAPDYRNETPVHPARGFAGRDQVRRNWEQILAFIPDIHATVLRSATAGDTVWSEWEHTGTKRDGTRHVMRGVVIFGVVDGVATWARFYLEPADESGGSVDDAVRRQVAPAHSEIAPISTGRA
jgi:ketosteroid isomerase-like protein